MPVTYKFETEKCTDTKWTDCCRERVINLTLLAFRSITNETAGTVYFNEVSQDPDISIYCEESEHSSSLIETLAEASCEKDDYNEKLISHATLTIYGQGMACNTGYPDLEVHEILHTFGFIHNAKMGSIMQPYSAMTSAECETTKIDDEYISCLKNIYSDGVIEGDCSKIDTITNSDFTGPCDSMYTCDEGWYEVKGTDFCCPEPNMLIVNDNCVEKCNFGYVYGPDYNCYLECGTGYYCPNGTICNEGNCYLD